MAAYRGRARVVGDDHVDASATSFRGEGWRISAEVTPEASLYGEQPARPVTLRGDTARPPASRRQPDEPFPPDVLRQRPFWDDARLGTDHEVLVVVGDEPTVRLLHGAGDDLGPSIRAVRAWTEAPPGTRQERILSDLAGTASGPVRWAAATELILAEAADPQAAVRHLLAVPGRPTDGLRAVLAAVPATTAGAAVTPLLELWSTAAEPIDLAALAGWFDTNRGAWQADGQVAAQVRQLARRSAAAAPGDNGWGDEAARYASALAADGS